MAEQKIKQDISIGANIRKIRARQKIGQTELVRLLQLEGVEMTRETLVKNRAGHSAYPCIPAAGNPGCAAYHL